MTVVSTLDVHGLTAQEYRAVMDELGVQTRPEGGIYLHLTAPTNFGFRVGRSGTKRRASIDSWSSAWSRQASRSDWTER